MDQGNAQPQLPSRKALRDARAQKQKRPQRQSLRTIVTMVAATGLLATTALPSYGFDPETTAVSGLTTDNTMVDISAPSQGLSVATVRAVAFTRGDYKEADASEFQVKRTASRSYSGPLASDYLAKPRFTSITSANLMKASAELVGTPYVFGGETPAGIDCSGYVMFVYAQFGIDLPHSVYQQSKLAIKVDEKDAVPGDVVVFNDYSHNGIYAGNGNFYHAPQPGDRVKLAPIFTDRYHIIRFVDIEN
ncbi:MAG: C40 family peptidase [Aquiluna sp.]|nr:C40 family peptidase [Aquiluna sp.]MCF8545407.1 C40 family peptidase [Aquiluna sp.]